MAKGIGVDATPLFRDYEKTKPANSVASPLAVDGFAKTHDDGRAVQTGWPELIQLVQVHGSLRLLYYCVFKRLIDITLASIALIFFAPLLLIVALAIRIESSGPIIFRQKRVGHQGRVFTIYKFRSMVHAPGSEIRLFKDDDGKWRHKIPEDPRVTRVGRVIRHLSIDELPQLFNVIQGSMSLVGPRPELPQIVNSYQPWQHQRHIVRPGLTGWWQVQGRSDLPMHENSEFDLYYVDRLSFRTDCMIIARTLRIIIKGTGAF